MLYQPVTLQNTVQFCIASELYKPALNECTFDFIHNSNKYNLAQLKTKQLKLPPQLQYAVRFSLSLVYKAYEHGFKWGFKYGKFLSDSRIRDNNPLYHYSYFLLPTGRFDDLKWVKQFVKDCERPILDRFSFACFYCFEEEIPVLWNQLKYMDLISTKVHNPYYNKKRLFEPSLICFWIHYVTNRRTKLLIKARTTDSIFLYGLKEAIFNGHEKAVHYFLNRVSLEELRSVLNTEKISKYIHNAAFCDHYEEIVHTLYSLLSLEDQRCLLQYEMDTFDTPRSWRYYLDTLCTNYVFSIAENIIHHHDYLNPEAYYFTLLRLVKEIGLTNEFFRDIFQQVWYLGSAEEKSYVLNNHNKLSKLLNVLLRKEEFTCAELLVK